MSEYALFTSESVSEGHPDKMADQISDAILDALLAEDPDSRAAVETLIKTGMVLVAGEIRSRAHPDLETVVRQTINNIGYNHSELGFDANSCAVLFALGEQSADIARGIDRGDPLAQGAGDQGMMFGYASDESPQSKMPAPIDYAHRLMRRQAELRRSGELPWLRPDAKSQISIRYANGKPQAVDALVFSTQHDPDISTAQLREAVWEQIIKPVVPEKWLHKNTRCHINPTGSFIIGGPLGDCGLTGRKIIVDTYGGMARHGGGAFSGKDPSKVDRSAAYAARYVAKHIVAAGLARRCEVQISYAIGVAEPTSVSINSFGSALVPDAQIEQSIMKIFDLRPGAIIETLQLRQTRYLPTASYGHFGREEPGFPWEKCMEETLCALRESVGIDTETMERRR